jgi:hypothetical protein
MRLAPVLLVTGALAAGTLAGGAAAATAPRSQHTAAGTKAAQATLLKTADLGRGWTARARTGAVRGVRLSCAGFQPRQNDLVEVGVAETPSFSGGQVGPYLAQRTSVFASATHVNRLWDRAVKPGLVNCVARDVQAISSRGLTVSITSKRMLPFARVAPRAALYRVIAAVSSSKQRLTLYFDVVLIANRRTITQLVLSQYQTAPAAKVEESLGRLAARRIGATPRA